MGKPAKGNSIEIRRSAAEARSRDAKIFVEGADGLLSYETDSRIPIFSQSIAEFVIGAFVIGAVISNQNYFENTFGRVRDFTQSWQVALGEDFLSDELPFYAPVDGSQPN